MRKFDPIIPWADIKREVGVTRLNARLRALVRGQRTFLQRTGQRAAIREQDWAVNSDPNYVTRLETGPGAFYLVATKTPRPTCIYAMRDPDGHDPAGCAICQRVAERSHPYE
jgi:hypothetical protein